MQTFIMQKRQVRNNSIIDQLCLLHDLDIGGTMNVVGGGFDSVKV